MIFRAFSQKNRRKAFCDFSQNAKWVSRNAPFFAEKFALIVKYSNHNIDPRDRCYNFKNIFPEKIVKNWLFPNYCLFLQN
jgi:hypothetical protein